MVGKFMKSLKMSPEEEETFTLVDLSRLTGFPVDLIKKELLIKDEVSEEARIPLKSLRKLMLRYLSDNMAAIN